MSKRNDIDNEIMVTIALPVFNGAKTLPAAIQSVLDQTYQNFEFIIIDDGSSDNSLDVINTYSEKRIKLIINKENIGLSASLNKAIGVATGDYFARMDQDDICFPCRVEKQVNFLLDNPEIDLLATSALVFDEKYKVLGILPVKTDHNEICDSPMKGFNMPHPTWMGKAKWFISNNYLSDSDGAEDQNLLFRTSKISTFACLSEPLIAYRERRRSVRRMFESRSIFAISNSKYALQNGQLIMPVRIFFIQCIKAIGDVLNIVFHISFMRNKFMDPQEETLRLWEAILQKYLL